MKYSLVNDILTVWHDSRYAVLRRSDFYGEARWTSRFSPSLVRHLQRQKFNPINPDQEWWRR